MEPWFQLLPESWNISSQLRSESHTSVDGSGHKVRCPGVHLGWSETRATDAGREEDRRTRS